jgi:hypothetical protein
MGASCAVPKNVRSTTPGPVRVMKFGSARASAEGNARPLMLYGGPRRRGTRDTDTARTRTCFSQGSDGRLHRADLDVTTLTKTLRSRVGRELLLLEREEERLPLKRELQ